MIDSSKNETLLKHFEHKNSDDVKKLIKNFNDNKLGLKEHFSIKRIVCEMVDQDSPKLIQNCLNIISNVMNVQTGDENEFKKVNVHEIGGPHSRNPENAPELHN